MTDYTNVSARALLVSASLTCWTGHKFDKTTTQKVNDAHAATAKAGRYNKHLLAGAVEHATLLKRIEAVRDRHYRETLPWADEGWRLLPTANYFAYTDVIRRGFAELDGLFATFIEAYPTLVSRAEHTHKELGRLWDPNDYPTTAQIKPKFRWEIEFRPVPAGGDIRVDLPADQLSAIECAVTSRVEAATRAAMTDAWGRLAEAVGRIQRATSPDGVIRSNLVDHVREVVGILGRLNIAGDESLEALRQRVERELTAVEPDDLRKSEGLRAETAKRAEEIMAAMGAFYAPAAAPEAA